MYPSSLLAICILVLVVMVSLVLELTRVSVILPTIMDKSLGTNLHLWRFYTRAKQIHLRLFISSPSPPFYNVGHVYKLFLQSFNIVLGEGGRRQHILKRITLLFENSILKTPKINAITQVSQGILSTIV